MATKVKKGKGSQWVLMLEDEEGVVAGVHFPRDRKPSPSVFNAVKDGLSSAAEKINALKAPQDAFWIEGLGTITETIFIKEIEGLDDLDEDFSEGMTNFCVDVRGRIRKGTGLVAFDEASEDSPNYVPKNRFDIASNPWNSHQNYVEIELPNPAENFALYQKVRAVFLAELQRRHIMLTNLVHEAGAVVAEDFAP